MYYENELRLLRNSFFKCHIQSFVVNADDPIDNRLDMGLYKLLGIPVPKRTYKEIFSEITSADVLKVQDGFFKNYIVVSLPQIKKPSCLIIGPFAIKNYTSSDVLEITEMLGITPKLIKDFEKYYYNLPLLDNASHLYALLDAFCEIVFGSSYKVLEVGKEKELTPMDISLINSSNTSDSAWNMEIMEARYQFENELIDAVSHGREHKLEMFFSKINSMTFENRIQDPIRNIKNYAIIMNTLLRKAAEQGGVHPVYLDKISSEFAVEIEKVNSTLSLQNLMFDMYRSYCRLVKNHSLQDYSPTVGKIITFIEADLTADLSLTAISKMLNVSASYLSSLFKKETGKTLTEFVNGRRIEQAKKLLKTTNLQVQTVAGLCGIDDVHYFSKMFKAKVGVNPKVFRETN